VNIGNGQNLGEALVSIVIPTYNQADYLAIAIESVLAQDYQHVECIVIDDGSTDGTPAVLERFRDRVICVRQENGGQSRALNRGWSMSAGAVLGYLSSDDRLLPQAVSQLMHALAESPSIMVVYCDFELIDARGTVIRRVETNEYSERRLVEELICLPGPGAIFRREVFDRVGGWRDDLQQCPDFEYWLRASRLGLFRRVNNNLAQFRIHEESASFRPISKERSDEIIDVMVKYCAGRGQALSLRSISSAFLKSARSHAQSGRPLKAASRFFRAVWLRPLAAFAFSSWKMLLAGFFRRIYYATRVR
jgi:glycosyltransferase involved in cell wall biosynthesis